MTRCPNCNAALDSMTELSRHECEPTLPDAEETVRIRESVHSQNDAKRNALTVKRAWNDFESK